MLRGGAGKYYAEVITPVVLYALEPATIAVLEVANDGRPGLRGQPVQRPGADRSRRRESRFCSAPQQAANFAAWQARNFAGAAPCVLRGAGEMAPPADYAHVPQTWQAHDRRRSGRSAASMSVEADYVYSRGRDEKFIQDNVNLSFTNASGIGINNPYTQPRAAAVPGVRHRRDDAVHRPSALSRAADGVHQAHEQPLAGGRDLLAGRPVERGGAAVHGRARQEPMAVPFDGRRRPRRTEGGPMR